MDHDPARRIGFPAREPSIRRRRQSSGLAEVSGSKTASQDSATFAWQSQDPGMRAAGKKRTGLSIVFFRHLMENNRR
jgi:hypothetical protein